MKKFKNYIEIELAKKKIARYKYWSVKDENGITISSSDEESEDNKNFSELLDKIIADNVDAEVQVKYGTNEASSRNNPPFFIKINEDIEWIEPEEETVNINGKPHKVDKNGNVNISFSAPDYPRVEEPKVETARIDYVRQEMDMQLAGLRREYELKEEKWNAEMQTKMAEQMLKFQEMMLTDREKRIAEREAILQQKEAEIFEKEQEIKGDLKGYLKQVPSALGSVLKELIAKDTSEKSLGKTEKKGRKRLERRKVNYSIETDDDDDEFEEEDLEELEETEEEKYEREFQKLLEKEKKSETRNQKI